MRSQAYEDLYTSMLRRIATVLSEHPRVHNAIACRLSGDNGNSAVAFALVDDVHVDNANYGTLEENARLRKWQRAYDLTQLTESASASPFAFNIRGWNSSYSRRPLADNDMHEWVQTTVDRIAMLAPKEVLEIGCGTGLLLLRLAPMCKRYVGLDFAPSVLARLRDQLLGQDTLRERVELLGRSADDLEGLRESSFDTVVINSVAQCFPSLSYLNRVIDKALRVVKPGGHVFVGDQRSLLLLKTQALSIEAFQAAPGTRLRELCSHFRRRVENEQELVLSPTYFLSLKQRFSRVCRVEIYPRRGGLDNEMTRFRYDAILWVGGQPAPEMEIPFLEARADAWKLSEMRSVIAARSTDLVGFARIRNSRVEKHVQLLSRLGSVDPSQLLIELQKEVAQFDTRGIDPEVLNEFGAEVGFDAHMSWAGCYSDGSYDALFVRKGSYDGTFHPSVKWPQPTAAAFVYFANAPGQGAIRQTVAHQLLSYCRARLSGKLVPEQVFLVDSFPYKADGSVDCDALLLATRETHS